MQDVLNSERVLFYEGKWYMFSNFASFQVFYRGHNWATSEHAYQADKFTEDRIRLDVLQATSAHNAKKVGRSYAAHVRSDWESDKLRVMEEIVRAKLEQHEMIQEALLKTGDMEMFEDSHKDEFWGRGKNWTGQNHLGKIWMKLRAELRL